MKLKNYNVINKKRFVMALAWIAYLAFDTKIIYKTASKKWCYQLCRLKRLVDVRFLSSNAELPQSQAWKH